MEEWFCHKCGNKFDFDTALTGISLTGDILKTPFGAIIPFSMFPVCPKCHSDNIQEIIKGAG